MPRNSLSKSQASYVNSDFSRYLNSLRYTDAHIGEVIGVSQQAANKKRRANKWSLNEASLLFKDSEATDREILNIIRV